RDSATESSVRPAKTVITPCGENRLDRRHMQRGVLIGLPRGLRGPQPEQPTRGSRLIGAGADRARRSESRRSSSPTLSQRGIPMPDEARIAALPRRTLVMNDGAELSI